MGERRLMSSSGGSVVSAFGIPRLIELYRAGALNLADMISQRLPLDECTPRSRPWSAAARRAAWSPSGRDVQLSNSQEVTDERPA